MIVCAFARFIPHPPHFVPLVMMGLVSSKLAPTKWESFLGPLVSWILTDLIISWHPSAASVYHPSAATVYVALLSVIFLGHLFLNKKRAEGINHYATTLLGTLVFFIISNLGVFLFTGMYALTSAGLLTCFTLALPFLGWSVMGDLFWSSVFYLGFKSQLLAHPQASR